MCRGGEINPQRSREVGRFRWEHRILQKGVRGRTLKKNGGCKGGAGCGAPSKLR